MKQVSETPEWQIIANGIESYTRICNYDGCVIQGMIPAILPFTNDGSYESVWDELSDEQKEAARSNFVRGDGVDLILEVLEMSSDRDVQRLGVIKRYADRSTYTPDWRMAYAGRNLGQFVDAVETVLNGQSAKDLPDYEKPDIEKFKETWENATDVERQTLLSLAGNVENHHQRLKNLAAEGKITSQKLNNLERLFGLGRWGTSLFYIDYDWIEPGFYSNNK